MNNLKIVVLITLVFFSCNKETQFVELSNHSGKANYSADEYKDDVFVYVSSLVKNLPSNKEDFKPILFNYHKKRIENVFSDKKVISYSTTFYEYNNSTAYFIDNNDDPGGHSSEILTDYYKENGIAEIKTTRTNDTGELKTEISFPNNENVEILK